jgi:phage terminase Nu1 subunit (DNA packaging protein)
MTDVEVKQEVAAVPELTEEQKAAQQRAEERQAFMQRAPNEIEFGKKQFILSMINLAGAVVSTLNKEPVEPTKGKRQTPGLAIGSVEKIAGIVDQLMRAAAAADSLNKSGPGMSFGRPGMFQPPVME